MKEIRIIKKAKTYKSDPYDLNIAKIFNRIERVWEKEKLNNNIRSEFSLESYTKNLRQMIRYYCHYNNLSFETLFKNANQLIIPSKSNYYQSFLSFALIFYDKNKVNAFLDFQKSIYARRKTTFNVFLEHLVYNSIDKSAPFKEVAILKIITEWLEKNPQKIVENENINAKKSKDVHYFVDLIKAPEVLLKPELIWEYKSIENSEAIVNQEAIEDPEVIESIEEIEKDNVKIAEECSEIKTDISLKEDKDNEISQNKNTESTKNKKPPKTFPEFLTPENSYELAEKIKEIFKNFIGKKIRIMIECLIDKGLLSKGEREFEELISSIRIFFGTYIGTSQSIRGYKYDYKANKTDYDLTCSKIDKIVSELKIK